MFNCYFSACRIIGRVIEGVKAYSNLYISVDVAKMYMSIKFSYVGQTHAIGQLCLNSHKNIYIKKSKECLDMMNSSIQTFDIH